MTVMSIYLMQKAMSGHLVDDSGLVNWRQTALEARNVSGPAIMGNYIVVGDAEGYLHWMSKRDGHFAARVNVPVLQFMPHLCLKIMYYTRLQTTAI